MGLLAARIGIVPRGMPALVIFDLDGTLIDSRRDLAESTNEMLASYGAAALPIDEVAAMVGEGAKVLVERALAAAGLDPAAPEALDRFRAIYDRRLFEHTRPYPGIDVVVRDAAAGAALAMLSNKPEAPSRRLLEAFDLSRWFRWVVGGDGPFPRKPDPAAVAFLMAQAQATAGADAPGRRLDDRRADGAAGRRPDVRGAVRLRPARPAGDCSRHGRRRDPRRRRRGDRPVPGAAGRRLIAAAALPAPWDYVNLRHGYVIRRNVSHGRHQPLRLRRNRAGLGVRRSRDRAGAAGRAIWRPARRSF